MFEGSQLGAGSSSYDNPTQKHVLWLWYIVHVVTLTNFLTNAHTCTCTHYHMKGHWPAHVCLTHGHVLYIIIIRVVI